MKSILSLAVAVATVAWIIYTFGMAVVMQIVNSPI